MYYKFFIGIAALFVQSGINAMENHAPSMIAYTQSLNGEQCTLTIVPKHYVELTLQNYVYRKSIAENQQRDVQKFKRHGYEKYQVCAIGAFGNDSKVRKEFKELFDQFLPLK